VLEAQRQTGQKVRIWCAGSATGEEPYSLALLLHRHLGSRLGDAVELFASDLNPDAIDKARRAVYTAWSFRGAPSWCFRFFSAERGAELRLSQPEVLAAVKFNVESCQTGAANQAAHSVDVVMFRNVAIYLEDQAIRALHAEFARILRPGGLLALGPSDPRPIGKEFQFLGHYDHAPVFALKPVEAQATPEPQVALAARRRAVSLRPQQPLPIPLGIRPASEPPAARAVAVVQALVDGAPLDSTAQRLLGLAQLQSNEPQKAVESLRRAVFLDATDVLSRYFYALALYENRDAVQALRQIANVVDELRQRPPDAQLPDGSTTAGELLSSANFLGTQWK
jgi:chemotaxis protein methyltransferase CheR